MVDDHNDEVIGGFLWRPFWPNELLHMWFGGWWGVLVQYLAIVILRCSHEPKMMCNKFRFRGVHFENGWLCSHTFQALECMILAHSIVGFGTYLEKTLEIMMQ